MTPVEVIVAGPGQAADPSAEFWLGGERLGVTVLCDRRLHLRIDPRRGGEPWLIETTSLALALQHATHEIARY
jgi:hypothetical protein